MYKLNCNYILQDFVTPETYAYISLAILVVFILYALVFYRSLFVLASCVILFVGGFLNASERLSAGCVKDYYNFFGLFSFNLADILVTIGVVFIILGIERYENRITYRR